MTDLDNDFLFSGGGTAPSMAGGGGATFDLNFAPVTPDGSCADGSECVSGRCTDESWCVLSSDGADYDDDARNDIPCRTMPNGDFKCTCDDDYTEGYAPVEVPGFTNCGDAEALCPVVGELRTGCIKTCGLCGWKHKGSRFGHVGGGERINDDDLAEDATVSQDEAEESALEEYGTPAADEESVSALEADVAVDTASSDVAVDTATSDAGSYTGDGGDGGDAVAQAVNDAVAQAVESIVPAGEAGSFSAAVEAAVAAAVQAVVPAGDGDGGDGATDSAPVEDAPVEDVVDDYTAPVEDVVADDTTADDYEIDYSTIDEQQTRAAWFSTKKSGISAPIVIGAVSGFTLAIIAGVMVQRRMLQTVGQDERTDVSGISLTPSGLDAI
jgi:hypothetical protein